ncbi:helix-turn-helix transcriptional regulator [Wukongibacter baidiensis]|uniref:helix-turn-helix domain-containing protein n=1 Tax=Wukongibacter baidiensis TaxID=1723361 RepID=UPI003D7F7078
MIKIQFLNEVKPLLRGLIRHYWYVNGEEGSPPSKNLLLPMDHVDLIITMGDPYIYSKNKKIFQPKNIHFHGIREGSVQITQQGRIQAVGISFEPWGFYFFTRQSMSQYVNKIVDLRDVNHSLCEELSDHMVQFDDPIDFIKTVEESLIRCVNLKTQEHIDCRIIEEFISSDINSIKDYCQIGGVSIRKLERIFKKYIGVSPKRFMNIVRFEASSRDMINSNSSSLTDISYKHGYYDQPHFARVFKDYTDYAPKDFQSDKPAVKSHFDYE